MTDALNALQTSTTITNSANSTALDLGVGGTLHKILWGRVISLASNASGNATISYKIQHSSDNSTWVDLVASSHIGSTTITTSTTATGYEYWFPIVTSLRYIRLVTTFSSTTGTPTTTHEAWIASGAPT